MKNRVVITTKGDNQLVKYIVSIQNEFLARYVGRSLKVLVGEEEGCEDEEFVDREEFGFEREGMGISSNKNKKSSVSK
jgi:hypothetical protein